MGLIKTPLSKQQIYFFVAQLVVQLFFCTVWAQDQSTVTFTGQVTRHEDVNLNVDVKGAVYIHYGYHDERFDFDLRHEPEIETAFSIEVPSTIPAGQRSVGYDKTVDWSLAGSVDHLQRHDHDFLRISVRCLENCEQANARETVAYSKPNGITGSNRNRVAVGEELYGTSDESGGYDRAGGYIVNLKLLPKYGTISGTLVLPDGETAPEELTIQLFGLDFATVGGSASTWWVQPTQQLVTFQAGASEMRFRFTIDLARLTVNRAGRFMFGYNCVSTACNELGLVNSALFDSDANRLLSINSFLLGVALDNFLLTDNENDLFNFQLPQPITMLGSNKQAIKIIQNQKETPFENQVSGTIIVEKYEHSIGCIYNNQGYPVTDNLLQPLDYSSDERCVFPFATRTPSIITVSEMPFTINAGDSQTLLSIDVHESDQIIRSYQPIEIYEHQRIKVVCDTGCESPRLKNVGYYREQSKQLMANSVAGAHRFLLTDDFSSEPMVISLENLVLPNFDLLFDEEEELEEGSH